MPFRSSAMTSASASTWSKNRLAGVGSAGDDFPRSRASVEAAFGDFTRGWSARNGRGAGLERRLGASGWFAVQPTVFRVETWGIQPFSCARAAALPKSDDAGDVFRTGAALALMRASVKERGEPDVTAGEENAGPLRRVHLVAGDGSGGRRLGELTRLGLRSRGSFPAAWTASVWKSALGVRFGDARRAQRSGWMTPVSLLASMIETRRVSGTESLACRIVRRDHALPRCSGER